MMDHRRAMAMTTTMSSRGTKHVELANQYIDDVLNGRVDACLQVRQACLRQRDDLLNLPGYRFDVEKAGKPCRFIERLPHIKGELAGQNIKLEPWQCFLITTAYGWVHDGGVKDGHRRFRIVYIEVPRGNGKSAMLSGLTLYALGADGEGGPEVYSAATTRDQAKIVFNDSRAMLNMRNKLRVDLGLKVGAHGISNAIDGGFYKALSSKSNSLDGLNLHFGCLDELHAHKTREIYDVLETALGKRLQSMLFAITTAGSNRSGICYEVRSYLMKILAKKVHDDSFFGIIYTIDDGDDWTVEAAWRKANPNWGISVQPDVIAKLAYKAMQLPSAINNFLTKHLDVWVSSDSPWMPMLVWDGAADDTLDENDFKGMECVVAFDLASKVDMAARVKVFRQFIAGVAHYYLFGKYYLPEQAIADQRNSQYAGWEHMGLLDVTPGDVIDLDRIEQDVKADASVFQIRDVAFDPFQAQQMANRLTADGFNMVEVRPTVLNFSEPMKEIEALCRLGRLHHTGDPVLAWMVSNVVCHTDAKDNIYPRKERVENKIDGVVATIMAIARWTVGDDTANIDAFLNNPIVG